MGGARVGRASAWECGREAEMLVALLMIAGAISVVFSVGLVGGYLDRRWSTTQEQALEDLHRYGPKALGLRVELLPPEIQAEIRAGRLEAEMLQAIRDKAKQTGGSPTELS